MESGFDFGGVRCGGGSQGKACGSGCSKNCCQSCVGAGGGIGGVGRVGVGLSGEWTEGKGSRSGSTPGKDRGAGKE